MSGRTRRFNIQPTGAFNLPTEKKVLQARGVCAKNVGKCCPFKVRGQRRELSLQEKKEIKIICRVWTICEWNLYVCLQSI